MHEPEVTDGIEPRRPAANLPDHRWVVAKERVIVDTEGSRAPRGLTRAHNGDLLLVAAGRRGRVAWRRIIEGRGSCPPMRKS